MTSVSAAFDYFLGLGIFGGLYWFLNGLVSDFSPYAMQDSDLITFANWLWAGALVIYLIIGAFWLPRTIKEYENKRRKK